MKTVKLGFCVQFLKTLSINTMKALIYFRQ